MIENHEAFRTLVAAKRRFILPATVFFIIYYFALPITVGYFPDAMSTRVVGQVNVAYLFALSQFFVAWFLAFWYLKRAARFDHLARKVRDELRGGKP